MVESCSGISTQCWADSGSSTTFRTRLAATPPISRRWSSHEGRNRIQGLRPRRMMRDAEMLLSAPRALLNLGGAPLVMVARLLLRILGPCRKLHRCISRRTPPNSIPPDLSAAAVATRVVVAKLKCETDHREMPSAATGCFEQFYQNVCIVCERPMRQKGRRRRQFCRKRCQSDISPSSRAVFEPFYPTL